MYLNDQMLDSGALRTRLMSQATNGVAYWDESVGRRLFVWDTINRRWQMVYGDTGWRDVTANLKAAHVTLNPGAKLYVRRQNNTVTYSYASGSSPTATGLQSLADAISGFSPDSGSGYPVISGSTINPSSGGGASISLYTGGSSSGLNSGLHVSGTQVAGSIMFLTSAAWPAALPGTLVTAPPAN